MRILEKGGKGKNFCADIPNVRVKRCNLTIHNISVKIKLTIPQASVVDMHTCGLFVLEGYYDIGGKMF